MKKRVVLFIFTVFPLILNGCSKDYMAEREFHKAQEVLDQVDLNTANPASLEPVAVAFQEVVNKYPSTPKALESLRIISNVRLKQKEYSQARGAMKTIVQNFGNRENAAPEARYRIAQIYELEDNWRGAENAYWELAEYHPLHVKALYAPVRILMHHKRSGNKSALEKNYVKALDHYESLIKQVGPIEQAAPVKNYLALAYVTKGETEEAVATWESITDRFPKNPYAPMALLAAAETSWKAGQQPQAEALYQRYFKDYPDHQLAGKTALNLGLLYHGRQDFEAARQWYEKALTYYDEKSNEKAEIKLLLAKSYQDEVLWDEADVIYDELEKEFAGTSAALQVPLLRASYFSSIGEEEKSREILDEALLKYEELEEQPAGEGTARFAERFKTAALLQKGAWDEVIQIVEQRFEKAEQPEKKGRWLFLKALLTQNRLKDKAQAEKLYQRFLSEYPNHTLTSRAQKQLDLLRQGTPQAA